jgi:glycosyltransferase involved in cell wall biosynthesis
MNALYNHEKVKVNVSFTHGEGFGMPLLEATLSGKPLLAPNWSGHLDFLDTTLSKLLPGELKQIPPEAVNDWFAKESGWFYVNYVSAGETMKNAFNKYESYLPNAEKLRIQNSENFSIQKMDEKFYEMLDRVIPKMAIQQTINLPKLKKITLPQLKKPVATEEIKPQ